MHIFYIGNMNVNDKCMLQKYAQMFSTSCCFVLFFLSVERVCRWCSKFSNNFYSTKSLGVSGKPRGINMTTWQAACFVSYSIYHLCLFKLNLSCYSRQVFTACLLLMSCKSPVMSLKSLTISPSTTTFALYSPHRHKHYTIHINTFSPGLSCWLLCCFWFA